MRNASPLRQRNTLLCRQNKATGATGLELATSGVTDHFSGRDVHYDTHPSALLMRFFGGLRVDSAWRNGAARDVCCPSAARLGTVSARLEPRLMDGHCRASLTASSKRMRSVAALHGGDAPR